MSMRLFFVLVALGGSVYLFVQDRTDRYVMGALVASSLGLLLQMNVIALRMSYARSIVWAAIAVCAGLIWSRQGSKNGATVAAAMAFVSTLTVALSLRILR
jgi:predicted Co/Zn/Cd cation transporter (cation efflux family)